MRRRAGEGCVQAMRCQARATDLDAQGVDFHQLGALALVVVAALVAARGVQLLDVVAEGLGVLGLQVKRGKLAQRGKPQALVGVLRQSKSLGVDLHGSEEQQEVGRVRSGRVGRGWPR